MRGIIMAEVFAAGDFPAEFLTFKYPLPNFSAALRGKAPVKIVAIGSSSTAGREDVVPYPHRGEMYLTKIRQSEDRCGQPRQDQGRGDRGAVAFRRRYFCRSAVTCDLAGRHQRGVP